MRQNKCCFMEVHEVQYIFQFCCSIGFKYLCFKNFADTLKFVIIGYMTCCVILTVSCL